MLDIDEVMMPHQHDNWEEMMNQAVQDSILVRKQDTTHGCSETCSILSSILGPNRALAKVLKVMPTASMSDAHP